MLNIIDMTIEKYNRLTPIERLHKNKYGVYYWRFLCDCGNETITRMNGVKSGNTKSCGCLNVEKLKDGERSFKHGDIKTLTYRSWANLRNRCDNPENNRFHLYGGLGITYCDRWNDFINFKNDMGERPSKNHSIERINTLGNYEPENCKWATYKEQANNRKDNIKLKFKEKELTISEWSEITKIKAATLFQRFHNGWDVEKILNTPTRKIK